MKKENQLILDLLRFSLNKKLKTKIKPSLKKQLDWNDLLQTSRRHGISPILYKTLKSLNFKNKIIQEFKNDYYGTYLRNTILYKELDKILKAFEKENIDVILLKGIYLAKYVYKDIGLRPMSDIDLLVKKQDPKIYPILKKMGYKRKKILSSSDKAGQLLKITNKEITEITYFKKGIYLEFHTKPIHIHLPYKEIDLLWRYYKKNDYRINFDITFLSVHLHKHSFTRLIWFYDLFILLNSGKKINWDFIFNIAKKEKLETSTYYSIKFIEKIFKTPITKQIKKIRPSLLKDRLFKKIWKIDNNFPFSSYGDEEKINIFFFNLVCMDSNYTDFSLKNIILNMIIMGNIVEKIKYIIDYIFPSKDYISIKYNVKNSFLIFLLYFYRPIKMIKDYLLLDRKY